VIYFAKVLIVVFCLLYPSTARAEWTRQPSGTLAWLRAVYFVDQENGWIAGSNGTLLATKDGGKRWQRETKFTNDNILDVYFLDRRNGWLLCEGDIYGSASKRYSYLLRTFDGGATWQRVDFSGGSPRVVRFFFSKRGLGTAVGEGGAVWQMQDDLKSWRKSVLPVHYLIIGGTYTSDNRRILVGAGGTILFTGDTGDEWFQATVRAGQKSKLNSVFFADEKNGWAGGAAGKIYVTKNGGRLWIEQRSGIEQDISDIVFLNSTDGFAVGDQGKLLSTASAGASWKIENISSKNKLERIVFTGNTGFVVGFGGTILKYQL
jgi:photosystem II stability/assembly factor-like uncharacterized protein